MPDGPDDRGVPAAIVAFAREGGWPAEINVRSGDAEQTALHDAAERGYTDLVQALLHQGADVFAVDGEGGRARQLAHANGRTDVVAVLDDWQQKILDHLTDRVTQGDVGAVSAFNACTEFPYAQRLQMLGAVAESGEVEVMRELLHGSAFDDRDLATLSEFESVSGEMKNTIDSRRLYDLVSRWGAEGVSAFLVSRPGLDTNALWEGRSAAHALADSAPDNEQAEKFRALKAAGADFSLRTDRGYTAQQYLDHRRSGIRLADI